MSNKGNNSDKALHTVSSNSKVRLCVITNTFLSNTGRVLLSKFLEILEPISKKIFVITEVFKYKDTKDNMTIISLKTHEDKHITIKIVKYILSQINICFNLLKVYKDSDLVVFYISSTGLTLPLIVSKIVKKKVVLIVSASDSKMAKMIYKDYLFGIGGRFISNIYGALEKVNYCFSDMIVIDSERFVEDLGLEGYRNKITVASERRFIDTSALTAKKKVGERKNLVGYIGRLSYEKGVMNFVRAIPMVLRKRNDLEFIIGGDGSLLIELSDMVKMAGIDDKVRFVGWIPHSELSAWLNELKLLVLPSYTEGLPNIVLEAMACGTPTLVTPVGALPDIIRDKETGFIMGDNSPESIAQNIIMALEYHELDEIASKAREFVTGKYTHEAAVGRYKAILSQFLEKA